MSSRLFNLPAAVLLLLFISSVSISQGNFKKPEPINNETVNMMLGKWESEPYEVFGSKRSESVNYYLDFGGQFLVCDIEGKEESGYTYKSKVILKIEKDGSFTGWSFDDWGNVGTYTGTASGNKVTANGKRDNSTDVREFTINGNTMTSNISVSMKWSDGQDKTINQVVTLNKK